MVSCAKMIAYIFVTQLHLKHWLVVQYRHEMYFCKGFKSFPKTQAELPISKQNLRVLKLYILIREDLISFDFKVN